MLRLRTIILGASTMAILGLTFPMIDAGLNNSTPFGKYFNGVFPSKLPDWRFDSPFGEVSILRPMGLTKVPEKDEYFISSRVGYIYRLYKHEGDYQVKNLLDISAQIKYGGDRGFFQVSLHPEFQIQGSDNYGFMYVVYSFKNSESSDDDVYSYTRLSRFTYDFEQDTIFSESEYVLIQMFDQEKTHTGGALNFDRYGYLSVSFGDDGQNDQFKNAQDISRNLSGGVIRIDVDKDLTRSHKIKRFPPQPESMPDGWPSEIYQGYTIPNDNPWVSNDEEWLEENYIIGLRNPHSVYYDSISDEYWVGDVGQAAREEISRLKSGENAQWPFKEGFADGPQEKPENILGIEKPPVHDYGREDGVAIMGGTIYRGDKYPRLKDKYIFGDMLTSEIWALDIQTGGVESLTIYKDHKTGWFVNITSVGEEVYVVPYLSDLTDRLSTPYNLIEPDESLLELPETLSDLGVFESLEELRPAGGFIPYELNSTLYSDNAIKQRWIGIPNDGLHDSIDEQVIFDDSLNWVYPEGSVFIKHFELQVTEDSIEVQKRLETRFLVVTADNGSYGVTYRWNDDGSDATLIDDSEQRTITIDNINGYELQQTWTFPSRGQCMTCHNSNAGYVLGIKAHSINREMIYPSTSQLANQISTWNHLNIFTEQVSEEEISHLTRSVSLKNDTASNELKVRSYLDANCSFCHMPGGVDAEYDARFITSLDKQKIVDELVSSRSSSSENRIIWSGNLYKSELYQRVHNLVTNRMPPVGRELIDTAFTKTLKSWICGMSPVDSSIFVSICDGEFHEFNGLALEEEGIYTNILKSQGGCDSTVTVAIEVLPIYEDEYPITICDGDGFEFGSHYLTGGGSYTEVFESQGGCDSTVTVAIEVLPIYEGEYPITICDGDGFEFGSHYLTGGGSYTEVFESQGGCDSTVTVAIEVLPIYEDEYPITICDGDGFEFGSHYLTGGGSYTEVFESRGGCDSIVTIKLEILEEITDFYEFSVCSESYLFGESILYESGVYTQVYRDGFCDSIVTVDLEFLTELEILEDDTSLAVINRKLFNYQWYRCGDDTIKIEGANKHYYNADFGSYQVEIESFTCNYLTPCFQKEVILDSKLDAVAKSVSVYPILVNDFVNVEFEDDAVNRIFKIINLSGRVIEEGFFPNNHKFSIDLRHVAKGVMFLTIHSENGDLMIIEKIIVK